MSKYCLCILRRSASECCRISVRSKQVSTLFPPQEELTVLAVEAQLLTLIVAFDCCFVTGDLLSLITRWSCFVWVRAGFLLAVRGFFTVGDAVRFFSNELLPIEYLRSIDSDHYLMSTQEQFWRLCFEGVKTSVECGSEVVCTR